MVLAGAPDGQTRDETAREFLEWGFSDFEQATLVPAGVEVGMALVQDGAERSVRLRTANDVIASLPREESDDRWTMQVVYRGPITAPITAGDPVARLQLSVDGQLALEVPLEAAETVPRANALQRVLNAVRKWTS